MEIIVSGSIVLYKADKSVRNAIESFLNTSLPVKLYLIDNSPAPEIKEQLKDLLQDGRVEYIFNKKNIGFGAAHNIAIEKLADSKYHLILNPDVYFDSQVISELIQYLDNNAQIAHVMPKVLYTNGELQYLCKKNPTYFDIFTRRLLPAFLKKYFKKKLDEFEYKNYDYNNIIMNIPFLSGCFMLIRTDILKKVKGFDENFFLYFEDADLTRKILKESANVYYPYVFIYHYYQRGTSKSLKHAVIAFKSLSYYLKKWGFNSNTQLTKPIT